MTLRLTAIEWERLKRRRREEREGRAKTWSAVRAGQRALSDGPFPAGRRWEVEFAAQLDGAGYAGRYVREHKFLEDRRFRFDFAFIPEKFAVEIDGAVHRIKKRFQGDREKGQLAILGDWRVLHVGPDQVRSGAALSLLQRLLVLSGAT